jgi:hypothetical protein
VVLSFWVTNHQALASFRALDSRTVRICIYLVGMVIFVPFTTKAFSDKITSPDQANLPLPTALYAGNIAAIVLATVALILVGRARGLAGSELPVPGMIAHSLAVAIVFLLSIPIAYRFGPDIARRTWLSLLVISPLVGLAVRRRRVT